MAAFPNTPSLPKFQQPMSRRAVMCTGIAATALAAVPVLAAVQEPDPDAALIAACENWQDHERRCQEAFQATDPLYVQARAKEPSVPAALFEELDLPPNGRRGPMEGKPWDPRDLKSWANTGQVFHMDHTKIDGALTTVAKWLPIPEATRIRAAEILAIHQRYERAKRRVWAKHDRAEKAAGRLASENSDRLAEVCEIPAHTIAGVHAKVKMLTQAGVFTTFMGGVSNQTALAISRDIARLAEAVQS